MPVLYAQHISPLLVDALADTPVVLLNGARQTGKSTLAQALAASNTCHYLALSSPAHQRIKRQTR